MTREAFRELVKKGPVLLDGATGTNLQKAGMPVGVCPEQWILENSEVLIDLQKRYVEAGTDILFAPTFTASRIKLKEYGLEDHLEEMNRKLVALSKEAAKGTNALVAGDLTMTGEQLYPLGDLMFEDLVDVYKEQAKIIAEAGADLFVVETMMSLQECRAAVLAIREVCDLPVMVSLTYNEDGRTLYGTDPVTAVVVMQSLGADAVGMNCSTGPEAMLEPIAKMAEYATIPLLAKPNAGMPELIDGQTVFNVEPEEFAEVGKKLVEEGAAIIGGCCGTTPEHIRALKEAVKGIPVKAPLQTKRRMLTSERKSVEITLDGRFMVIGERINPTGKKKLQAELKEGSLNLVRRIGTKKQNELELDNRKAHKMSAGSLRKFLETMEREMLKTDYGSAKLYYDNYIRGLYEVFGGFSEYDNMIARIDMIISYVKSNYPDRLIELLDSGKEQFTIESIYDPIARDAKLRRIEEAWKTVYDEIEAEETKLPRGKSIFDWSDF